MQKSFTEIVLYIVTLIYTVFGIFHLTLPRKVSLFVIHGVDGEYVILLQRFLGTSFLFIGLLLYLLIDKKGQSLYIVLGAINIVGFINLYLIFLFNSIIHLSSLYFIFIILVQVCLFICLIEQLQKK